MIPDLSQVRVFVRPGITDMRKQISGLAALVRDSLGCDPLDGSLYLFVGKGVSVNFYQGMTNSREGASANFFETRQPVKPVEHD